MSELIWTLTETDIEWLMKWSESKGDLKGPDEWIFEKEAALAHLLINDVIFLNSFHYEKTWPEKPRALTALLVNCNDIFAWACADAQELPFEQIEPLYRMWRKDPIWGSAVWCMIQRNEMPQAPVAKAIKKAGIWDLAALKLGENITDEIIHARIQQAMMIEKNKINDVSSK